MRRMALALAALVALGGSLAVAQEDKAADVMKQMREALGGDKLAAAQSAHARRAVSARDGHRQMQGTMALTMQLPDKMHRSEDTEFRAACRWSACLAPTAPPRGKTCRSAAAWAAGMQIVHAPGPAGRELNPQAIEEARLRRMRTEFKRYLLAFLGGATLQPTWRGRRGSAGRQGRRARGEERSGRPVRIFVDQQTHMPLMLQYQEVRPRMMIAGGPAAAAAAAVAAAAAAVAPAAARRRAARRRPAPCVARLAASGQRPDPEEMRRRMEAMPPPAPSQVSLYLGDYKRVDGVMLPHRLTQAVDGKPVEEWTIEKGQSQSCNQGGFVRQEVGRS